MNTKSKNRIRILTLALSIGIIATVQVGCQVGSTGRQSYDPLTIPGDNPPPVTPHFADCPLKFEGNGVHQPSRMQSTDSSGSEPNRVSGNDIALRGEHDSNFVFYNLTDLPLGSAIVPEQTVIPVSWDVPISAPHRSSPTASASPLWRNSREAKIRGSNNSSPIAAKRIERPAVKENWDEPFAAARKLEQKEDLHGAALIYDELVQRGIEQPKILHRLAVCYDLTDRPQLSLPLYERALDLDPQNSDILCDLGYRLQLVGNMTAAERFYTQALQYDQNHARANNHLGVLLAQDDRSDQALRCFQAGGLNLWQAKRNLAIAVQNRDAGLTR